MRLFLLILNIYFAGLSFTKPAHSPVVSYPAQQKGKLSVIAKNFLLAKQRSFQEHATKEDVEAVLNFCSDSVKYDHILSPEKEFSFSGKSLWRSGSLSHLGETRNVKILILQCIERQNVVVVEYRLYREVKTSQNWEVSGSTIVSIMEFDKQYKIRKLTDYL